MTKPAAVILAAGESRRMGRPKALLPFRQGTFLSAITETLSECCAPVVVVFGFEGEALSAGAPSGVIPVINHGYRAGMLTSLQTGLRMLDLSDCHRILFTLVDHPAVCPETVAEILRSNGLIAIPRFQGRRGHPVAIHPAIAREFLLEPPTAKVRHLIDRHAEDIEYIDLPDPGITDDIDDPNLYHALLEREAART